MTAAIQIHGVRKAFGLTRALRGIDVEVPAGRIFGFLGPNGAGKTTTARILLDFIRPDAGTARVSGLDCQRQTIEMRRRTGYLPGELRLYEGMRGVEFTSGRKRTCVRARRGHGSGHAAGRSLVTAGGAFRHDNCAPRRKR